MPRVAKGRKKGAKRKPRAASGATAASLAKAVLGAAGPYGALAASSVPYLQKAYKWISGSGAYRYRRGGGYRRPYRRMGMNNAFPTIRGRGDYSVSALGGPAAGAGVPQFSNAKGTGNGNIRFAHREYLQDIVSTTTFTNITYNIQPGLPASFPFLSAIAANFEEYKLHGLVFYFRSTSGTSVSSATTALGTVVMATQYDALGAAFVNKQEMENYQFAVSGAPCYDLIHTVECAKKETPLEELYIRTAANPSNSDLRLYDYGVFNIATVGMQSASNNTIGELWVSYDIELLKPRVPSGQGSTESITDHFQFVAANVSSSNYFGSGTTLPVTSSTIGGKCGGSTYTFPSDINEGTFMFVYAVKGASTTLTNALLFSNGTNLTAINLVLNDTTNLYQIPAGAVSTLAIQVWFLQFNGATTAGQSFATMGAGTLPASISGADLFVTNLNPALVSLTKSRIEAGATKAEMFKMFREFMAERLGQEDSILRLMHEAEEPPSPSPSLPCEDPRFEYIRVEKKISDDEKKPERTLSKK